MAIASLGSKWQQLKTHPGFEDAPVRTLFRLASWRTHCLLNRSAVVELPQWGVRMFLPPRWGGEGTTMIYATREYYELELKHLDRFVSHGMTFVDGGANLGVYTLAASKLVGESGRVLSFEPGRRSFAILGRNADLNGLRNVQTYQFALSDEMGRARLYHHSHGPVSFSLGREDLGAETFEEVSTVTLDHIASQEQIERIDFIKLDVEGAEELVLRGALQTLTHSHPTVLFETNKEAAQRLGLSGDGAWSLLSEFDYKFYAVDEAGGCAQLPEPPARGNVLAVHRGEGS